MCYITANIYTALNIVHRKQKAEQCGFTGLQDTQVGALVLTLDGPVSCVISRPPPPETLHHVSTF